MKEYFKGVVWPRESSTGTEGPTNYRYVVVGMLVTDHPLELVDGAEIIIDSTVDGMAEILTSAKSRLPTRPLGDANMVLLRLGRL